MKKISVEKIVIRISGKELELTIDEALELRDILTDTFGKQAGPFDDLMLPRLPCQKWPQEPYHPWDHWTIMTSYASDRITLTSAHES